MPNIWAIDEPEETTPEESAPRSVMPDHNDHHGQIVTHDTDELEKPSFLRRLTKRHKDNDDQDNFTLGA